MKIWNNMVGHVPACSGWQLCFIWSNCWMHSWMKLTVDFLNCLSKVTRRSGHLSEITEFRNTEAFTEVDGNTCELSTTIRKCFHLCPSSEWLIIIRGLDLLFLGWSIINHSESWFFSDLNLYMIDDWIELLDLPSRIVSSRPNALWF